VAPSWLGRGLNLVVRLIDGDDARLGRAPAGDGALDEAKVLEGRQRVDRVDGVRRSSVTNGFVELAEGEARRVGTALKDRGVPVLHEVVEKVAAEPARTGLDWEKQD
jgi:hypothetical protein